MEKGLDIDEVWRNLGPFGKYQKFQLFFLSLGGFASAFALLATVVIGYRHPYTCAEIVLNKTGNHHYGDNIYAKYHKCSIDIYRNDTNNTFIRSQACTNGYAYPVPKDRTFVTEWDLVCKNAELAEFTQTLVMIGQAAGAFIFTQFSDRYGRKPVNMISHVGVFAVSLTMVFVPGLISFAILRFFVGMFQQGVVMTENVIMLEILPKELRYIGITLSGLSWITGIVCLAFIGYLLQDYSWRYLQLTFALYSSYSLLLYWIIDESPRWLLANGKLKEAERILRKASRWNKVDFNDIVNQVETMVSNPENGNLQTEDKPSNTETCQSENGSAPEMDNNKTSATPRRKDIVAMPTDKRYTFVTIFRNKKMLRNSVILWYIWIVNSLVYYGISLISYTLAGNRFLNFFLIAVMDYPATISTNFLVSSIGRKKTLIFFHAVTGLSCIIATTLRAIDNTDSSMLMATTVLTLIAKFGSSGSYGTLFVYTPETYPTNLRNAGFGVASTISRIGGMLATFAGPLADRISWAPGAIFGSMCMLVTILATRLPETRKHVLPQTLEEIDKWKVENEECGESRSSRKC